MNIYRNAKPNEFILKRDSDGRETFETRGIVFAVGGGCGTSETRLLPIDVGVDDARLCKVIEVAESLGFWVPGNRPSHGESPFSMQVYVL